MKLAPFAGPSWKPMFLRGKVAKYTLQGNTLLLSFLQYLLEVLIAVIVLPGVYIYAVAHTGSGALDKHDHWLPWHDLCSLAGRSFMIVLDSQALTCLGSRIL